MVRLKNVGSDPVFTIEKQCDRCRNVFYFADTVITDVETDDAGKVVYSSIICPICGNVIVLYSIKDAALDTMTLKVVGSGDEA